MMNLRAVLFPLIVVVSLCLPIPIHAQTPLVLGDGTGEYPLGSRLEILEDKQKVWSIGEVSSPAFNARFMPSPVDVPNFGFTSSAYWARFRVRNDATSTPLWMLEVAFPDMNRIELYQPLSDGSGFRDTRTGNLLPLATRDVAHHNFIFNVGLIPGAEETIYLRFENTGAMRFPVTLWSPERLLQKIYWEQLKLGIFYGALLIMLAYNLFLFFGLRDKNHLYYVCFLLSFLWTAASLDRLFERFWFSPAWNRVAAPLFSSLTLIMALKLSAELLTTRIRLPRLHNVVLALQTGLGALIVLIPLISRAVVSTLTLTLLLVSSLIILIAGFLVWRQGHREARNFLWAWTGLLGFISLTTLARLGLLPVSIVIEEGPRIGVILWVSLLSLSLADRFNAEREEAEGVRRDSEEQLRRLSEATFEGIGIIDEGRVIEANFQLAQMLGYEPADIIGMNVMDLVAPESHDLVLQEQASGVQVPYEHRALRKDGSIVPVEVWGRSLPYKGRNVRVTVVRDVTERKQAETELYRRNRELTLLNQVIAATTVNLQAEAILQTVCRELAHAFEVNQAVAILLNKDRTELKVVAEYLQGAEEVTTSLLGESAPLRGNSLFEDLDRLKGPVAIDVARDDARLTPVRNLISPSGIASILICPIVVEEGIVGVFSLRTLKPRFFSPEDFHLIRSVAEQVALALARAALIDERRALEAQSQQAQKMEAIGRLTAAIAHDFNNMLTAINGFAGLMELDLKPADPHRKHLANILNAGERAANLVRQLLAFGRKQIIEPRVLNLNTTVMEMDKMLQQIIGENISLEASLASGLWQIKADPSQMEQVIVNLAVNARDAMPEGGRLTIQTANAVLDPTFVACHLGTQVGEYVRLTIRDTGHGMSGEIQARVFEPFFSTKDLGKGTGLGLATVHGIVERTGGSICVDSRVGAGTTFDIYVPRETAKVSDSNVSIADKPLGGAETILLVEDDAQVRDLIQSVLGERGYPILIARDAQEALQVAAQYNRRIDLLLTDVVMPGMSGKALADEMARTDPRLKILFISGYSDDAIAHHGVKDPDIHLLQKPFSPLDLARKVREVLD